MSSDATTATQVLTGIQNGVTVASSLAAAAAPLVSVYNPAAGAALTILAPVVSEFVINQTQILITLNTDMTDEELKAALLKVKSANWGISALETL